MKYLITANNEDELYAIRYGLTDLADKRSGKLQEKESLWLLRLRDRIMNQAEAQKREKERNKHNDSSTNLVRHQNTTNNT